MSNPTLYWLWLAWVLGPAPAASGELLALYGSAEGVFAARGREDFSGLLNTAQAGRLLDDGHLPGSFDALFLRCEELGVRILCYDSPDYPPALADLPDAPPVLYSAGLLPQEAPYVGMVGSRRPSEYGVQAAKKIGEGLAAAGAVLVSGLADGLDSAAHRAALGCGMPTVAVLGTAIDKTYPATNRLLRRQIEQNGAVLSEYPPGAPSSQKHFLQRNRLIAGLSQALCVIEARYKSGTMSTVSHARRYGVPVWAVPGSIFSPLSEGTNALLSTGDACALTSAGDLLPSLGLAPVQGDPAGPDAPVLDADALAVLRILAPTPKSLGQLTGESGLPAGRLLAALTRLELAGRAAALAGRQYRLA